MDYDNNDVKIAKVGTNPALKQKPSKFSSLKDVKSERKFSSLLSKTYKKELFNIDANYIPTSKFHFVLDKKTMSYKPIFQSKNESDKMIETIKMEAMEKIKQYKIPEKESNISKDASSSYLTSSYNDGDSLINEEEEENSLQDKNKKIQEIKTDTGKIFEKKTKEEIEGQYYRVNGLDKIRFMIYDFEQEMVVDKGIMKDNKSEVENIMSNQKFSFNISLDKDGFEPYTKLDKFLSKYSSKDVKFEKKNESNNDIGRMNKNQKNKNSKEIYTHKKIENYLKKNNKEKLTILFVIISFICGSIILIITIMILYFAMDSIKSLSNNILSIIYSVNIISETKMEIYYVREMTLLSIKGNVIYDNNPFSLDREEYIRNITQNILKIFELGHKNIETKLNKKNSERLYNKTYEVIIQTSTIPNVQNYTIIVGIIQLYSILYNLIITGNYDYKDKEVLNFLINSLNNVGTGCEDILSIYLDELLIKVGNIKKLSLVFISLIIIIFISIFIALMYIYSKILEKKQSYISFFYEINLGFIQTSMRKCEKFINKINPNQLNVLQEKYMDNCEESKSDSIFGGNYYLKNEQKKKENEHNKISRNFKKSKFQDIAKNRKFKIRFFLFLFLTLIYFTIYFWFFIRYIILFEIAGFSIFYAQRYENNLLNLFNAFREFIFDESSTMKNKNIQNYIGIAEREIYDTILYDMSYLVENKSKIETTIMISNKLQKYQLCNLSEPNYNATENKWCNPNMEVKTSLGFYVTTTYVIEEIRIKKNKVISMLQNYKNDYVDNISKRIEIFNQHNIHGEINILFANMIIPYIIEERDTTISLITEFISSKTYLYIALAIAYIVVLLFYVLLYWYPIISKLSNLIYKTKNMLTIIPIEILSEQTSIKNLLGVTDLND